jgi:hypothetical protein
LIHNNLLSKTYQEPKLDFYTNTDTSTLEFLLNENLNKVSITIKSF